SNVFQHVALTYDTNSGTAMLFYDGTNVATTNWGVNIVPRTTGDVLLGKDMSLETNNYFGGLMDEMSIYNRALSDAELAAIYSVSAYTTNRLIGKFDPTVTPPLSLAEAQVVLGDMTNTILGQNNTWQEGSFTFYPQTNVFPMQVKGIEPGMLFDAFGVSEAPLGNMYYLPEQSLAELKNQRAGGNWTLEIWDTRNNTLATNADLLSWQLQFHLETNTPPPISIGAQEPTSVTILPGQIVTLAVPVPVWAADATNILVSSTEPLNVFYNANNPPSGSTPPDTLLFAAPTGTGSYLLTTNNPPPNITPGGTYYIGLQNTGPHAASAVFEVDFNITALTNDVPFYGTLATNTSLRYFSFDVASSNAYEATFQLLGMNGNADLVVRKGLPLPDLTSSDYGSFNSGYANETIYVLTNSTPVPLTAGRWYLGVINRDTHAVNYTVLARELDLGVTNSATNSLTLIQLTNGVPFDFTAGPGAALTNFFYFPVTNSVTMSNGVPVMTNDVGSIHFELYNLTGNGDLTVQTNAPPFAPPFFQSSDEPGTVPEFIQIRTNSALTNLAATWYLGVPNETTNLIHFTIIAVIDTNNYFPAFPGAEGAGAGALGASWRNGYTNNTVYHVVNLDDSGPGSLRDAVNSTNRTIVFDTSGVIHLQTAIVVTNSYLTIVGQTAPAGGITVADAPL
ncbi:MAG: LamG-like jellyroll fold domain-containing protein, partial [Limisphaerales bacterium]